MIKKVSHAKGDLKVAFARLRDSPMANSKMSPARLMFRRILRFPGLPVLPDNVDEVVAGEEKQARKVVAKDKRNSKVSNFGKEVVELEEGLHILLQDDTTKLFDIEAQVIRVGEGGRSAYVQGRYRGGRLSTFLRNRRFMIIDPKFRVDDEAKEAMATAEVKIGSDNCLPLKQLSRKAKSAFKRTKTSVSSILKGSLSLLTRSQRPTAEKPRRKTVSWKTAVAQ